MSTDDADTDTEELEERVDELESTVQKLMPSRRDMLKLGGAAAGGALLAGSATGGASGQTSPDQAGAPDRRYDAYIAGLDANQLSADLDGNGKNLTGLGSVSTGQSDVTQQNVVALGKNVGTEKTYPVGDDAAQAVKDAIADLGTEGGKVLLPGGVLPWKQEVTISADNANLGNGTPLIIEGTGMSEWPQSDTDGTVLDAHYLSDGQAAIKVTNQNTSRARNRALRDFTIAGNDTATRSSTNPDGLRIEITIHEISKVRTTYCGTGLLVTDSDMVGVDWDFWAEHCHKGIESTGLTFSQCYVTGEIRECMAAPAAHFGSFRTSVLEGLIESNDRDGMWIDGTFRNSEMKIRHFENNNTDQNISKASDLWVADIKNSTVGPFRITGVNGSPSATVLLDNEGVGGRAVNTSTWTGVQISGPIIANNGTKVTFDNCNFEGEIDLSGMSDVVYNSCFFNGTVTSKGSRYADRQKPFEYEMGGTSNNPTINVTGNQDFTIERNGTSVWSLNQYGQVQTHSGFNTILKHNNQQSADPDATDLNDGECAVYVSDGTETGAEGDLVWATNDGGTIKTLVIAQVSNAT